MTTHSDTASESSDATNRLRDALRLLRCFDKVEITSVSRNWDAQKCFVLMIYLRDTNARKQAFARGETRNSPAPFQLEKTPAELHKLFRAMRQWCSQSHVDRKPCTFCTSMIDGSLVAEAVRSAHEKPQGDVYESMDDEEDTHISSCCFGFLPNAFRKNGLEPESGDEWAAWLNACVAHVRAHVPVTIDADETCDGAYHVPSLLTKFLLESFMAELA